MSIDASNPLANLCRYYLACLARDANRNLSEFASSKNGVLGYAELSELPGGPGSSTKVWEESGARTILRRFATGRDQLSLYFGYPVRLFQVHARSGWRGVRIEPLLVFELSLERGESYPKLIDPRPEVNLRALGALEGVEQSEALKESLAFQAEVGISGEIVGHEELEDLLVRIPALRPEWPWCEDFRPSDVTREPPLSVISTEGIYNRAILLTSERSKFTRGLELELAALGRNNRSEYRDTALGRFIHDCNDDGSTSSGRREFIELLDLNTEQRAAVQEALTRPLTVVTGPPGTGKSQVVASIVANCAWRGEKVLVASKTHKAIDVVEERVNSFGPRPLLLRLGPSEYQTRLANYLSSLLSAGSDPDDESTHSRVLAEYQTQIGERETALQQLNRIVKLRNQVDDLEQQIECVRNEIGEESLANLRRLADVEGCLDQVRDVTMLARNAGREKQSAVIRLLWPLLRSGRITRAVEAANEIAWLSSELSVAKVPLNVTDGMCMVPALEAIERRLQFGPAIHAYFAALDELNTQPTTGEITRLLMRIGSELRSLSDALWRSWLKLQPSRLTPSQRRLLGDYKALLDMRISADERGERMGSQSFRRFMQMFPEISKLFPAWAVTNLSARGRLPFEPAFFDLLVIDEASQCDIASALPLLYRSKRAVIIGDPKQLSHISQIPKLIDRQLFESNNVEELGDRWAYTSMSLYDLAASVSDRNVVDLRDHHRSAARIIGFSNRYFYEDRLRVATRHHELRVPYPGAPHIDWVHVRGRVQRPPSGSAFNRAEAAAVIEELRQLLVEQGYEGSVGVVTPFRSQANLLRRLIHDDDLLMRRIGTNELLVDTAYRFQGDERDVMLFSPVISNDVPPSTLRFLNANPNTFNVAVTRARASLIVIGDHSACMTCGVEHLEAFAKYATMEVVEHASEPGPRVDDLGPDYPAVANSDQVSKWEVVLYQAMYRRGLRPIPQYSVEHFILDFALFDGDRKLNIEVDGEHYHRSWTGELTRRDQIRNGRLIELGWDVIRFWVYQIRDDLDLCIEKVVEWHETPPTTGVSSNNWP